MRSHRWGQPHAALGCSLYGIRRRANPRELCRPHQTGANPRAWRGRSISSLRCCQLRYRTLVDRRWRFLGEWGQPI